MLSYEPCDCFFKEITCLLKNQSLQPLAIQKRGKLFALNSIFTITIRNIFNGKHIAEDLRKKQNFVHFFNSTKFEKRKPKNRNPPLYRNNIPVRKNPYMSSDTRKPLIGELAVRLRVVRVMSRLCLCSASRVNEKVSGLGESY